MKVLEIYEKNQRIEGQAIRFINWWANKTGVRMDFGRITKYL